MATWKQVRDFIRRHNTNPDGAASVHGLHVGESRYAPVLRENNGWFLTASPARALRAVRTCHETGGDFWGLTD